MFEQFCAALALECIFMKHGRQIVLDAVLADYVEIVSTIVVFEGETAERMVH